MLHVTGRIHSGDGSAPTVVLALRQGRRTVYEGPLDIGDSGRVDVSIAFRSQPLWGHPLLLMRIADGDKATFEEGHLALAPYSATYAEQVGLVTPAKVLRGHDELDVDP